MNKKLFYKEGQYISSYRNLNGQTSWKTLHDENNYFKEIYNEDNYFEEITFHV